MRAHLPIDTFTIGMAEYTYEPLYPDLDTLRLIELEPSNRFDASVCCQLKEVIFSQLPKYDALSYRWGDGTKKQTVFVGGKAFQIGENLFEALRSLRNRENPLPLWADAISINQQDIPERNRQIQLMPHIYRRAVTVLIWLGKRSVWSSGESWQRWTAENRVMRQQAEFYQAIDHPPVRSPQPNITSTQKVVKKVVQQAKSSTILSNELQLFGLKPYSPRHQLSLAEQKLLTRDSLHRALCNDPYWERVWIIQEVGLARKIRVCFDENSLRWSEFILEINLNPRHLGIDTDNCGPIRIDQQLKNKYKHGHTLVQLLRTYKDSKCQDPRDKIYGFVGLAIDCHEFPMDYSKSTYEVWTDTMTYIIQNALAEAPAILNLGRLIKRLLGGENMNAREFGCSNTGGLSMASGECFPLSAYVVGKISYVDPSPQILMSEMKAVDTWTAKIGKNCKHDLAMAREENENFIHALIRICQSNLEEITTSNQNNSNDGLDNHSEEFPSGNDSKTSQEQKSISKYLHADAFGIAQFPPECRAFQYKSTGSGTVGLGPKEVREGDLLCRLYRLHGVEQVLVIRDVNKSQHYRMVGKAVLSTDLFGTTTFYVEELKEVYFHLNVEDVFHIIT